MGHMGPMGLARGFVLVLVVVLVLESWLRGVMEYRSVGVLGTLELHAASAGLGVRFRGRI